MTFLKAKNENRQLHLIPKVNMNCFIGEYILEFKNQITGEDVEPDTLSSAVRMLNKYLQRHGCNYDISKDHEFELCREVLATRRKELTADGKGNKPNKAVPLTKSNETALFERGQMGLHSPKQLINMLWYGFVKCFGMRGSHKAQQLKWVI